MKMHKDMAYWDRGMQHVPSVTGAAHLMAAPDLRAVLDGFNLQTPLRDVLDVGCGTGRAAQLCTRYLGVDIAPSAISYCMYNETPAQLITGASDIPAGPFDMVLCISVFTHMGREERRAYLAAFHTRTRQLIADIIRGDGSGDVECWTALEDEFVEDLAEAGFTVRGIADYQWDMHIHTYAFAEVAG